jgi:hypothetical protein
VCPTTASPLCVCVRQSTASFTLSLGVCSRAVCSSSSGVISHGFLQRKNASTHSNVILQRSRRFGLGSATGSVCQSVLVVCCANVCVWVARTASERKSLAGVVSCVRGQHAQPRKKESEMERNREIGTLYIYVYIWTCCLSPFSLLRLNLLYRTRYIYYVVVK